MQEARSGGTPATLAAGLAFALATLLPVAALVCACLIGGNAAYLALIALSVLVYAFDHLPGIRVPALTGAGPERLGQGLALIIAVAHFALLVLGVAALSGSQSLDALQTLALWAALGMFFGQISNSCAHELIHARSRARRRLGAAIFTSLLFGHHASAHLKVHHTHVATEDDPNSARRGEGFYRFFLRAWAGSFRAGLRAENRQRGPGIHPYAAYIGGAFLTLAAAGTLGGPGGIAALISLAAYAQVQLLVSDYVQHYGLRRTRGPNGRPEPVGPAHAWNASPWYSGAMMLNAPRHSDHHLNPARPFPALRLPDDPGLPLLPASFQVMGLVAAIPPLWRHIMDPRLSALTRPSVNHLATSSGAGAADLADSGHAPHDIDSADDPGHGPDSVGGDERGGL